MDTCYGGSFYPGNLGALDITLSQDDLKRIDELATPLRATFAWYGPHAEKHGFGRNEWGPHSYRWN